MEVPFEFFDGRVYEHKGKHVRVKEFNTQEDLQEEEKNYRHVQQKGIGIGPHIYNVHNKENELVTVTAPYRFLQPSDIKNDTWNVIDNKITMMAYNLNMFSCNITTRQVLVGERGELCIDAFAEPFCTRIDTNNSYYATMMKIIFYLSVLYGQTYPNEFNDKLSGDMKIELHNDWKDDAVHTAQTNERLQAIGRGDDCDWVAAIHKILRKQEYESTWYGSMRATVNRRDFIERIKREASKDEYDMFDDSGATHGMSTSGRMELRY